MKTWAKAAPTGTMLALGGITLVFALHFAWIKNTNFGGHDEWVILWLTSKGIISTPYANRPLNLLWSWPGPLLSDHPFQGLARLHRGYLLLSAFLVFGLSRRLVPGDRLFALTAGVLFLVWAPGDFARYTPVQMTYSGVTASMLAAAVLFVEGLHRGKPWVALAGAVMAGLSIRSYEGVTPFLAAFPVLLLAAGRPVGWRWWVTWEAAVVCGAGLFWVGLGHRDTAAYQMGLMGMDLAPARVGVRLARQVLFHLGPLAGPDLSSFSRPAVPLVSLAFLTAYSALWLWSRPLPPAAGRYVRVGLAGFLLGCLGFAPLALSASVATPTRAQFLSAPGMALFLAGLMAALVGPLRARTAWLLRGALGAWVVAVGVARAGAIQRAWDNISYYRPQISVLREVVRLAPDLRPNTLVLLVDEGGVFPATFTFRHAVDYLYAGKAVGHVWNGDPFLYGLDVTARGFEVEPWPVIQAPWGMRPTLHRADEVLVMSVTPARGVEVLSLWPENLSPLPHGAAYEPYACIRPGPGPRRAVLERDP